MLQTGCAAIACAKVGLLVPEAALAQAGDTLRKVCEAVGISPVLHLGSCVDNSLILMVATNLLHEDGLGEDLSDLPIAGALSYGFPTIADTDIPQILPTGICTYEHVVSSVPLERIVEKSLELRGCKVRVTKVPIPVSYGPAFAGERIRKEQTYVESGGNRTPGFEYVTTRDPGQILHARLLNDYPAIVDKVQVTLYTERQEVEARLAEARRVYSERNLRIESLTDESVDTFYSGLLCQSFAPSHVCVITPERLGLCGAYNWLDGKAAYEIDPTDPNQPLIKGECLDPVRGQWQNINEYVYANSKQTIRDFLEEANHPALSLREITAPSPEAAAVDAARGGGAAAPVADTRSGKTPTLG